MSTPRFDPVDQSSPLPFYRQVSQSVFDRIHAGEWAWGERLPSESELCEAYQVSRITIRQALALLVQDGLVVRSRGKGTFVRGPFLTAAPRSVSSFTAELRDLGMKAGSRILKVQTATAREEVAAEMGLAVGRPVVRIRRLRTADGRPIGIQDTLLVADRFPGIASKLTDESSLYSILRDVYGVIPTHAVEVFRSTGIRKADAAVIECDPGQPAFEVTRLSYDDSGIFERTHSVLHGDRYQIRIALTNRE